MLKTLRVPERLFQVATWVVSLLFASFLIGLGGKVVADLPGVDERITRDQFVDSAQAARLDTARRALRRQEEDRTAERDRAQLTLAAARNAYGAERERFANWIATRTATTDPRQDPEVVRRTRELDALRTGQQAAQTEVERVDAELLRLRQSRERLDRERARLVEAAAGRYERSRFGLELRVFAIRLAITLPLLVLAGWLAVRKRRSEYWPLARGFVLFAVFVFFVELVPYLPSYGGYVRYGVGVVATAIAGVYLIRAMRRYVARRAEVERQSEVERRRALGYEEALKRMAAGVCPGCERPIAKREGGEPANFCVHCGMTLLDNCAACGAQKNAFFQYCPTCGSQVAGAPSPAAERLVGA